MGISVGWAAVGIDPDIYINVGYRKREVETLKKKINQIIIESLEGQ